MKWSAAIFCVLIIRPKAAGQIKPDGTIIAATGSEKEIVIAADSRKSGTDFYTDDECKISAFGDKIIFAASGRTGGRHNPSAFWDAYAIAGEQYKMLTSKGSSENLPFDLAN